MARIRTIKPEFWTSEQVMECEPLSRLLFIGIWNFCDDAGNHPMSEKTLKALVFPADDIDSSTIRRLIDDLSGNGLLSLYSHSGKSYLHVNGWHHQKIEKPTIKHPAFQAEHSENNYSNEGMRPVAQVVGDQSSNDRLPIDDGKGVEGKGKVSKNQKPSSPGGDGKPVKPDPLQGFAEFWIKYPRKTAKQDAEKAWAKLKPSAELQSTLITAVDRQAKSLDWTKDGGKFIPHPATWLNGKRWEDQLTDAPLSKHGDFDKRDYYAGLTQREDGTYAF